MDVQKISKRPPFYIFRNYATYRKLQKNSETKFGIVPQFLVFRELLLSPVVEKVVVVFLSLKYGADFGRSRLVCIRNCQLDINSLSALCQELLKHWTKVTKYLMQHSLSQGMQGVRKQVRFTFTTKI